MEQLLFAILIAGAAVPLLRKLPRVVAAGLLLVLVAVGFGGARLWADHTRRQAASREWLESYTPTLEEHDGYVSSDTCRPCHPDAYDTWHGSFHRTMTQLATPEAVQADFDGVELEQDGTTYRLSRRGDEYWTTIEVAGQAEPIERRIGMLTGSHHLQVFWMPTELGNRQYPFPFAWLIEEGRWVPNRDTFLRDPDLPLPDTPWNGRCIDCHSVAGQPRPDDQAFETRVGELGIACEGCHGPAADHIAANRHPLRRYRLHRAGDDDPTIVDPSRLDHARASEVCGHCHSIKYIPDRQDWAQNGFRFRPGEELREATPIVQPSTFRDGTPPVGHPRPDQRYLADRYWLDGMVRVSGREYNGLIDSPCFQRGTLSCLSCHSMHGYQEPNDQLGRGMDTDAACLDCHAELEEDVSAHTFHEAGSSGSRCYNCHMPHTTYGLLKAIRSHQIDSPSVTTQLATGRPNACNLCHLDRTLGWTADKLAEWYGQRRPTLPTEHEKVSSALLDLLRGDAGRRALIAWHMGWQPAVDVSGEDWLAPWLALSLHDRYSSVRFIAYRSLRQIEGFTDFDYDYVAEVTERRARAQAAMALWEQYQADDPGRTDAQLLVDETGALRRDRVQAWLAQRDRRSMDLQE